MFQTGETNFALAARSLKRAWPFCEIMHYRVKATLKKKKTSKT